MNETQLQVAVTAHEYADLIEVPADTAPLAPNEVAGRTLYTLISAGTELSWAYTATEGFPHFVGYAAVFEVDEVGAEVTDLRPGDRAFCMGPHASHQRQRRACVVPVPADLPPEQATIARMMQVSMSTLVTTTARPPAPVLVTGLGPVGHLAAQVFQACGYEVLAVDPVAARREAALRMGVRHVAERPPEPGSPGYGNVALVLECSGHEQAVLAGCRCVRKRGEVVLVGVPWRRKADLQAFDLLDAVFHNYAVLRSGWEWEIGVEPQDFHPGSMMGNLEAAVRWIAEGRVRVDGLYALRSPREAQECYQALLNGKAPTLMTVFDWTAL